MNILHVVHEFAPFPKGAGGTGRYVYRLVRAQEDLGHDLSVLTQKRDTASPHLALVPYTLDRNIRVYPLNITLFQHPEELYRRDDVRPIFRKLLSRGRYDFVHIHHFIGLSAAIAECCAELAIPYGITFHDFWPFCIRYHMIDYGRDDYDCARLGYGQKDCIRCLHLCHFPEEQLNQKTGEFLARYLEEKDRFFAKIMDKAAWICGPSRLIKETYDRKYRLSPERFLVEPLGMDFIETPPDHTNLPGIQFGYIGSIESRKGVNLLLRVFERVDFPLHLWGNDPGAPSFREYAKSRPNLHYHGGYDATTDLAAIFSRIHVTIIPSLSESFGITARESLSHRVPVIASDWGGMAEAVVHKRNGILFRVGDQDALRAAVEYAAAHPREIHEMEKHTLDRLISMDEHARRMLTLYG